MNLIRLSAILAASLSLQAAERVVEISAYDARCVKCCGKWAKFNRTSSGTVPTVGRTVACNFLKPGTRIVIEGIGERVVEDTLNPRFGHRVDLLLSSHSEAKTFGVRKLKVTVQRKANRKAK